MPVVELVTGAAYYYRIDSRSWPRITQWLDEWLPQLRGQAPLRVRVMPLVELDGAGQLLSADWVADNRAAGLLLDVTGLAAIEAVALLGIWRGQLQAWIDEGAPPGRPPAPYWPGGPVQRAGHPGALGEAAEPSG
jgi:hypothetical protein